METRRAMLKYLTGAMGATACGLEALESFARPAFTARQEAKHRVCRGRGAAVGRAVVDGEQADRDAEYGPDRAARAAHFAMRFVVNALCLPSRATMLTGMYSHTTGAVSNVEGTIPARFTLVSDLLQKAGYETAFIGKSHVAGALMDHYWDYYFGFVGQADYYRPKITEGVRGKYGQEKLYEGEYVDTLLTRQGCRAG